METFVRLYYGFEFNDHKHLDVPKPFMMEKIKPELNVLGFVYKYIDKYTIKSYKACNKGLLNAIYYI